MIPRLSALLDRFYALLMIRRPTVVPARIASERPRIVTVRCDDCSGDGHEH